ncbi:hypothetical protein PFISCL1PPCAC_4667, partial [Pristionchus fissidentatus]
DRPILIGLVVLSDLMMYLTLPLHIRLLFILLRRQKRVQLDGSFHTLMVNTTMVNLIFSVDFCFIQAPAATGFLYNVYDVIGPVVAKIELIKMWERVAWLCYGLWILTGVISIPIMLPGTNTHFPAENIFNIPSVQFTFLGNYYMIYSVYGSGFATIVELCTVLFYVGMIAKFNEFRKLTKSNASDVRKMTMGVVRTTVAAILTSMGSWVIVIFISIIFSYEFSVGHHALLLDLWVRLLNTINNVLTPWVLLFAFPNVRRRFY